MKYQPHIKEVVDEAGTLESGATEQEIIKTVEENGPFMRNEDVEFSLLPHFTTSEWATISLV